LKEINDRFGHTEGDKVILTMARTFRKTLRDSDIVARVGGDEFVVMGIIQHESDENIISSRILAQIKKINDTKLYPYTFSISIGVSSYDPAHPCTIEELLQRADQLMYEEKRFKNQTS
jgi:diguanylate cyclase (GGDEF)-like protein